MFPPTGEHTFGYMLITVDGPNRIYGRHDATCSLPNSEADAYLVPSINATLAPELSQEVSAIGREELRHNKRRGRLGFWGKGKANTISALELGNNRVSASLSAPREIPQYLIAVGLTGFAGAREWWRSVLC
jgi:hypothetical protein